MEKREMAFEDLFDKPARRECQTCNGSGECFQCAGTGLWYEGTYQEETCTSCNGSGGCRICSGCSQGEAFVRSAMRQAVDTGLKVRELKAETETGEAQTALVGLRLGYGDPVGPEAVREVAEHYAALADRGFLSAILAYQAVREFRDLDRSVERAERERTKAVEFYTAQGHPEIAACLEVVGGLIRSCRGQTRWARDIAEGRERAMRKLGLDAYARAFAELELVMLDT